VPASENGPVVNVTADSYNPSANGVAEEKNEQVKRAAKAVQKAMKAIKFQVPEDDDDEPPALVQSDSSDALYDSSADDESETHTHASQGPAGSPHPESGESGVVYDGGACAWRAEYVAKKLWAVSWITELHNKLGHAGLRACRAVLRRDQIALGLTDLQVAYPAVRGGARRGGLRCLPPSENAKEAPEGTRQAAEEQGERAPRACTDEGGTRT